MIDATALWPGTTGETSMAAFEDAAERGAGQRQTQDRKSTWKGVLLALGALMAVSWVFNVYDQLTSKPATQSQPTGETAPTGDPVTLTAALREYKTAQAHCEAAEFGSERHVVTIQTAQEVCTNSMQAVMDLPAIYGQPAAALQSCIDMEGARLSALNMAEAIQDNRGDPMQDQMAEKHYIQNFRSTRARCASDLVKIQHAVSVAQ